MDQEAIDNLERVLQNFTDQFSSLVYRLEQVASQMNTASSRMSEAAGMNYMAGRR